MSARIENVVWYARYDGEDDDYSVVAVWYDGGLEYSLNRGITAQQLSAWRSSSVLLNDFLLAMNEDVHVALKRDHNQRLTDMLWSKVKR
jgi:hypothetical protein